MPTLYPGAKWEPLGAVPGQALMKAHDLICIHTMVGSLRGTDSYFEQAGWGGTESHFGTGYDGEVIQWQDTDRVAEANLNGNWHIISIENADVGTGFPKWNTNDGAAVPAFTDAQVEANAQIIAWACKRYNIPCELVPDSKVGRRGICYHRQGCDPYRVAGGELWSSVKGKVCPGNRRIAQIPAIIARAKVIMGGEPPIVSKRKESEDLMTDIRLDIQDDLTFRTNIIAESGAGSAIARTAWLCMGSVWGWTEFLVTAHGGDGGIIYQWRNSSGDIYRVANNYTWPLELPQKTRMVVVEGKVENHQTLPAVAVFHLPNL